MKDELLRYRWGALNLESEFYKAGVGKVSKGSKYRESTGSMGWNPDGSGELFLADCQGSELERCQMMVENAIFKPEILRGEQLFLPLFFCPLNAERWY